MFVNVRVRVLVCGRGRVLIRVSSVQHSKVFMGGHCKCLGEPAPVG